jgi:hypothetical protein
MESLVNASFSELLLPKSSAIFAKKSETEKRNAVERVVKTLVAIFISHEYYTVV